MPQRPIQITAEDLPLVSSAGVFWIVPIDPPRRTRAFAHRETNECDMCPLLGECWQSTNLYNGAVGCEGPARKELRHIYGEDDVEWEEQDGTSISSMEPDGLLLDPLAHDFEWEL